MANITPDRLIALKAAVKAECQRRCNVGSVAEYAGSSYDYTNVPAAGRIIAGEHYTKIMTPLNAITAAEDRTVPRVVSESETAAAEAKIADLASRAMYSATLAETGCAASCTGLCYGNCTGTCSGCSGTCTDACTGSCSGCSGCGGACSRNCDGSCDGCSGGCDGCDGCSGCGSACSDGCTGCSGWCTGGCSGTCGGTSVDT